MKAATMLHTTTQGQPAKTDIPTNKQEHADRIRALNDAFRQCPERGLGVTGRIFLTRGISAKGWGEQAAILQAVKTFNQFDSGNDPWGEHDFGALDFKGERIFWKIDCYSRDLKHGSPDPTDPAVTCRVLTVMLASEY